jgi:hypothetical protein
MMTCNACKQQQSHLISTCLQLEHKHTQISLEIFCEFHTQNLQFNFVKSKYESLSCWFSSCFICVKAFQSIVCCYTILFHAHHHCIFLHNFFFPILFVVSMVFKVLCAFWWAKISIMVFQLYTTNLFYFIFVARVMAMVTFEFLLWRHRWWW